MNKVQNLRKDSNFNITDRIKMAIVAGAEAKSALEANMEYVQQQTLCVCIDWVEVLPAEWPSVGVELDNGLGNVQVAVAR